MYDYKTSEFKKTIGITEQDLDWIRENKKKKSAAGFLKEIINLYKNDKRKPTTKAS